MGEKGRNYPGTCRPSGAGGIIGLPSVPGRFPPFDSPDSSCEARTRLPSQESWIRAPGKWFQPGPSVCPSWAWVRYGDREADSSHDLATAAHARGEMLARPDRAFPGDHVAVPDGFATS